MKAIVLHCFLILWPILILAADADSAPSWKAGAASIKITPTEPMTMAGYGGRKEPAEGTEQDLFAKALAIEDESGEKAIILTMDLIGVRDQLRKDVVDRLSKENQIQARSVLMNASHTHCGPAYYSNNAVAQAYYKSLVDKLVAVSKESLKNLKPAQLTYSHAQCGFAMNRRTPTENGVRNHPNPTGVVDHSVPVLRVANAEDELVAVLFGYACHNTTMGFRKWLGDYAGYAQEYFEERHPGVTALYMAGCGGDQNPYPRSMVYFAQKHGRSLCTAVEAALEEGQRVKYHQRQISGGLQTALDTVHLEYTDPDRESWDYPVQLIQFGKDLTIVALGTEVVVDYSLRLKKELGRAEGPAIWVAAYSNVYSGYIPSKRVSEEGGYEASRPYKPETEDKIISKASGLYKQLNP